MCSANYHFSSFFIFFRKCLYSLRVSISSSQTYSDNVNALIIPARVSAAVLTEFLHTTTTAFVCRFVEDLSVWTFAGPITGSTIFGRGCGCQGHPHYCSHQQRYIHHHRTVCSYSGGMRIQNTYMKTYWAVICFH